LQKKLADVFGAKQPPTPLDLIQKYARDKTFADIGCMWGINGAYAFFAESCGAKRVVGVDAFGPTDEFQAEHSRLNSQVEFILGDITRTETARRLGKLDVIYCGGVLYHMPDPILFLQRLRSICDQVLILHTALIPEMPGLSNTAVFYPNLNESQRNLYNYKAGKTQVAITSPFDRSRWYDNWWWGLTPSCVESMLLCAEFTIIEKHIEPLGGFFVCRA
jgi:hypothetical protein